MKNKKIIAVVLCIGVLGSGVSAYATNLAQSKDSSILTLQKYDTSLDHSGSTVLPDISLVDMASEVNVQGAEEENSEESFTTIGDTVLYEGTQSDLDPDTPDLYHIDGEMVETMMDQGFSVEDIFEADKIGNETGIEPQLLLEEKENLGMSLEQVKESILSENKEKVYNKLKDDYKDEYKKLKSMNFQEDEIMNLLAYANINQVTVMDEMIDSYKKNGNEIFNTYDEENGSSTSSKDKSSKAQVTNIEGEDISPETLSKLEKLSDITGKTLDTLIEEYRKAKK